MLDGKLTFVGGNVLTYCKQLEISLSFPNKFFLFPTNFGILFTPGQNIHP